MANKDLQRASIQGAAKTDTKTNSQPKAKATKNDENSQGKANANAQNKTNSQGNAKAQIHGETSIKAQTKAEIHANSQTSPKAENIAQSAAKTTKAKENLLTAKKAKKDEFYTQFNDIQKELANYVDKDNNINPFENKVVYCNCDDPKISNFFLYFANFFWTLNLKKVICSCYKNNDINLFSQHKIKKGCYFEYDGRDDKGRELRTGGEIAKFIESGLKSKEFQGNGDFRSKESIALLKQADIVVTNPPFSLFREYVAQLIEFDKKFIIIGNVNAISYKEIFKLIMANKIWLGASIHSGDREFGVPKHYPLEAAGVRVDANGNKFIRVKGVRWFVNLNYPQRTDKYIETIYSCKEYPDKYPKYDNYDAINVDKTNEIPMDYKGAMGVPITFLDKYNPKQFEILALGIVGSIDFTCNKKMEILDKFGRETGKFTFNAKGTLYRKFNPKTDKAAAFKDCETGELYSSIYARVIIKNKFPKKD